jgi:hypothetical protein
MKKNSLLLFICLAYLSAYVFEGCRKEKIVNTSRTAHFNIFRNPQCLSPVMTTSFTEDFNEYNLGDKGWVLYNSGSDFENIANYDRSFNRHTIGVTGLYSFEEKETKLK